MPSGEGRSRRTTPGGAIKALFKAAAKAAALRSNDAPKPERKRRGGTDSSAPVMRAVPRASGPQAARGRYSALWRAEEDDRKARETADDFAAAAEAFCKSLASSGLELLIRMFEGLEAAFSGVHEGTDDLYLASGLELVQAWQDNAQYDCLDDIFSSKQDRYFPQP